MLKQKISNAFWHISLKSAMVIGVISSLPSRLFAAPGTPPTNPWSEATAVTPDTLESTTGQHMSKDLAYGLIGGGVILLVAALGVLISLLNADADDKKREGAFKTIMQIVILIFCVVVGIVLIGLGWTGITALGNN